MKKRITRITIHQTAWTVALWSFLIAMVAWVIWSIIHLAVGQWDMILWGLLGVVLYGVFTYVYWVIGALIYNWTACWTGGIELKFEECSSHLEEKK
ncbi:MAG: hypothetical protein AB7F31_07665 [Parachlamydiales bacterium]